MTRSPRKISRSSPKAKWLALYRRLMARMTALPSLRFEEKSGTATFFHSLSGSKLALIRTSSKGLEIGLRLSATMPRTERLSPSRKSPVWVTHWVLIASPAQIDDEFLGWVKVARLQAGSAKPRSTSRAKKT